jgi:cell division protein FtsZ
MHPTHDTQGLKFAVIGIGNFGLEILNQMYEHIDKSIDLHVFNTDKANIVSDARMTCTLIGEKTLKGLGCGSNPANGQQAAIESQAAIEALTKSYSHVTLITALGGGTGSGAAPVIASLLKDNDAVVHTLALTPFKFEGVKRNQQAQEALVKLNETCHSVIEISNEEYLNKSENKGMSIEQLKESINQYCVEYIHKLNQQYLDTPRLNHTPSRSSIL